MRLPCLATNNFHRENVVIIAQVMIGKYSKGWIERAYGVNGDYCRYPKRTLR